jgi:hypothetical protein
MWKNDLLMEPVFGFTSSLVMKACVGRPSSFYHQGYLYIVFNIHNEKNWAFCVLGEDFVDLCIMGFKR